MNNAYISSRRKPCPSPLINMGSTIFVRLGAFVLFGLAMLSLASCGGNSPLGLLITPPDRYGAFAYEPPSGRYSHAWAFRSGSSRSAAESAALAGCAGDCRIILYFSNQCGALATGEYGSGREVFGVGVGRTESDAQTNAIGNCSNKGGIDCRIETSSGGDPASSCV